MSEERKAVLIPIGVAIVLLLIIGVGIGYYKPSYCKTAIGFITCWRNKQSQSAYDYDEEFLQNDLEEVTVPKSTVEPATPTPKPTVLIYEDLENAITKDDYLEEFLEGLKIAIEDKRYDAISAMVYDNFVFGVYLSEYTELDKEAALQRIQEELDNNSSDLKVDISNEGRLIAQDMITTPNEPIYVLVVEGVPNNSFSVIGIKKEGPTYFWSDLIIFPPR